MATNEIEEIKADEAQAVSQDTAPVQTPTQQVAWVYNSKWDLVDTSSLGRSAVEADIAAYVESYNATHTTNHLFIMPEETPVSQSPYAKVAIVDAYTNKPKMHIRNGKLVEYKHDDIPRWQLQNEDWEWRWEQEILAVGGGVLYIDVDPPAEIPPIIDTRTDYEKYAIYVVEPTDGTIIGEEHCNETWPECDRATVTLDQWFELRVRCWTGDYGWQGKKIITGKIYTVTK